MNRNFKFKNKFKIKYICIYKKYRNTNIYIKYIYKKKKYICIYKKVQKYKYILYYIYI